MTGGIRSQDTDYEPSHGGQQLQRWGVCGTPRSPPHKHKRLQRIPAFWTSVRSVANIDIGEIPEGQLDQPRIYQQFGIWVGRKIQFGAISLDALAAMPMLQSELKRLLEAKRNMAEARVIAHLADSSGELQ